MVLVDTVINKIPRCFHKPYISSKTFLAYSKIHFRHCQELNDKIK